MLESEPVRGSVVVPPGVTALVVVVVPSARTLRLIVNVVAPSVAVTVTVPMVVQGTVHGKLKLPDASLVTVPIVTPPTVSVIAVFGANPSPVSVIVDPQVGFVSLVRNVAPPGYSCAFAAGIAISKAMAIATATASRRPVRTVIELICPPRVKHSFVMQVSATSSLT